MTVKREKEPHAATDKPRHMTTAAIANPAGIASRPEARGRNRFRGCARSESRSKRSFTTYVEEAQSEKATNAMAACSTAPIWVIRNEVSRGTKTSRFFSH